MKIFSVIGLLLLLLSIGCRPEPVGPNGCEAIDRDNARYQNALSDEFTLASAKIEEDCLLLTVRYGGGCGTVDFDMVAIEGSAFSLPPQIPMRLILDDEDPCEALITDEIAFDLAALQGDGAGAIQLAIETLSERLEYQY